MNDRLAAGRRPIRRAAPFLLWLTLLYGGWILAWVAHQQLLRHSGMLGDRTLDTAYWLVCKGVVWLLPVALFIRHEQGTGRVLDWLGLKNFRGLWLGAVVSALWLVLQAGEAVLARQAFPARAMMDASLLSALVVAPAFEEIIFRGYALRRLRELGARPMTAVALSALAWALLHVPGWLFQGQSFSALAAGGGSIVIFGLVLGALRLRAPSLWAPILVHLVNNAWHQGALSWLLP